MGIRSRLAGAIHALTGRAAPGSSGAAFGGFGLGGGPMTSDAFGRRAPSAARMVEAFRGLVYSCADGNASAVCKVPLRLYARTGKGQAVPRCGHSEVTRSTRARLGGLYYLARTMNASDNVHEVTEHPLLDALDDPNPEFDRQSLIYYLVISLDVVGGGFLRPVDGGFGPPAELWPLEPQYVLPVRATGSAVPTKYTYFTDTYLPDELIRFRRVGLRDAYGPGYSPGQASYLHADLEDRWLATQDQIMGAARPGLLVSPADAANPFGPDERTRLDLQLNAKFARSGSGNTAVANVPLSAVAVPNPQIDPQGVVLSRYDMERVANAFKYPVAFLTGETNLANLQAAHRQHSEQAVMPRCHILASALTRYARRFDARLFFAFDCDLQEDEESRAKVWDIKIKNGSALINEARADEGDPPVPWGDEPWFNQALRQPSEERPPPPGPALHPAQDAARDDAGGDKAEVRSMLRRADELLGLIRSEREDGQGHFRRPPRGAGGGGRWAADRGADRIRAAEVVPPPDGRGPGEGPP